MSKPSFKDCFFKRDKDRILSTLCSLGPGKEKPWARTQRYATARPRMVTAARIGFPVTTSELFAPSSSIIQTLRVYTIMNICPEATSLFYRSGHGSYSSIPGEIGNSS